MASTDDHRWVNSKLLLLLSTIAALTLLGPTSAWAHTDSDVVAVPAGASATVTLEPTHGCDGSPTTGVAIQAPVGGATAGDVAGWTATATADGDDKTVLEWTGGSLPADATGAFPVTFTAPDTPGELLTFPSIQYCENGEELSWISGDPAAQYPAPRLLILPAGSEPAATLEDVPSDAPGRDQLAEIVDVDGNEPPATTTPADATSTTSTTETSSTSTTQSGTDDAPGPADSSTNEDDDSSSATPVIIGAVVLLALAGAAWYTLRRRAAHEA